MVKAGRRRFEDGRLRFFDSVPQAIADLPDRHVLMAQGSLQSLPDPMGALEEFVQLGFLSMYLTRFDVVEGMDRPVIVRLVNKTVRQRSGTGS